MLLLLLFYLTHPAFSQVATPPRQVGLPYPYSTSVRASKIHLEVFLDLLCPDSAETWPHVKEVADWYSLGNLSLTVHLFPLPYHQNAFYASRATFVIHYLTNGSRTFDWIDKILLEKLSELSDRSFYNKSDSDLLELFADYVTEMGLNKTAFKELVDRRTSNQFERYTRVMWKHACVRGVAETPTFTLNGIIHPNIKQSWQLADWKNFLDPLMEPQIFDGLSYIPDSPHHQQGTMGTPCPQVKKSGSNPLELGSPALVLLAAVFYLLRH